MYSLTYRFSEHKNDGFCCESNLSRVRITLFTSYLKDKFQNLKLSISNENSSDFRKVG